MATLAGVSISGYLVCVEGLQQHSSLKIVAWTYSSAAVLLWIGLLVCNGLTFAYSRTVWEAIVLMAVIPQILGHTLLNSSLRFLPGRTVALAVLAEPVVTAVLAAVLLHEKLTALQIIGVILVLAAIGFALSAKELSAVLEEL